jgi:hypothetical protein
LAWVRNGPCGEAASPKAVPLALEAWAQTPKGPLRPGEIDQLLAREMEGKFTPAPLTTDEQFLRRVRLDLTGELPTPGEVARFVADTDPHKRSRLIDRLLDSDACARHWARYWRDVILARATAQQVFLRIGRELTFEPWLYQQFKANKSWAAITRALVTAEGTLAYLPRRPGGGAEPNNAVNAAPNGAAAFLLCHFGPDAASERAAETARVFLGIQLQCAQCHNHPFDRWKREQFHELAAFYGRTRERLIRDGMQVRGVRLAAGYFGEHRMPDLNHPGRSKVMHPRFLTGEALPEDQGDRERRKALAHFINSKDNFWFAAAYVNRMWGELLGQSFYQPVDDMGPMKEAVFPTLLARLAAGFQAADYDTSSLLRAVLNSQAYQRQTRLGPAADQHLHFAASYPTRLRADALFNSLVGTLGQLRAPMGPQRNGPFAGLFGRFQPFERVFKREFDFDPSLKADEVEGTIPQALLLMNHPVLAERIRAKDGNVLDRILKESPADDDALRALYLRTLARRPTDRELEKCRKYVARVGNRAEAFEDLLWALINSTEFQTRR